MFYVAKRFLCCFGWLLKLFQGVSGGLLGCSEWLLMVLGCPGGCQEVDRLFWLVIKVF